MSQFYQGVTAGSLPPSVPTSFTIENQMVVEGTSVPVANVEIFNSTNPALILSHSGNRIDFTVTDALANYTLVTGPQTYDVLATDYYLACDSTAGMITIKLPNTTTSSRQFIIKDRSGTAITNSVTVTTVGGIVPMDGNTSYTFGDNYESLEMIFNGSFYETF